MGSLRSRLILSHILPLVIIIPFIGIALIYVLETQVLLTNLADELTQQAILTTEAAADRPEIWQDSSQAQVFVTRIRTANQSEIRLLDLGGTLLASNDPEDTDQLGQLLELPNLPTALAGNNSIQLNYSLTLQHVEVVEILAPVAGPNQEVVGIVRLTQELSGVYDRFLRLRYLVAGILAVALLVAIIVGLILALNLERPIQQVTQAVYGIASGREWSTLAEQGPTEIRLLVQAFNSLIERLRLLEETRRRLLANIVHEVSRPVGALQSAIQALLNGADEDPILRRELLEGMEDQTSRLQPLLDNLAGLHGQVLGTLELKRQPTPLTEWLRRIVSPWREAAQAKGLEWQMEIPNSLPVLDIDADRLAQVVGNLLSNAIKYTPQGTISLEAHDQQEEGVVIVVTDTGLGIPSAEQNRVFEPFYRSQRLGRFPQGMGLGLTIAHDLVTAHGGRLTVDSRPDQGSRFTIWLPGDVSLPKAMPEHEAAENE